MDLSPLTPKGFLETRNMGKNFVLRHGQIPVLLGLNCDLQNMLLTTIVKQCVWEPGRGDESGCALQGCTKAKLVLYSIFSHKHLPARSFLHLLCLPSYT